MRKSVEIVLLIAAMLFPFRTFAQPTSLRPNFIFFITDDQRWDELGCVQKELGDKARFPWFTTPNMDRLAAEGVRFRNMFVVNSLCSPSRADFLTGQYNHINGVINNHTPMPLDTRTSAVILGENGYSTAYVGKFHHGNQKERPGFQYIASYINQGKYQDCPFNVNGTMTPSTGWIDDVATDYAIQYLKDHTSGSDKEKPFFMVLGFKSPHDPRTPPDRDKDLFADTVWSNPVPNLDTPPPFRPVPPPNHTNHPMGERVPMEKPVINKFRCIYAADEEIGRVMQTLDDLQLTDNTMIIFVGDNGYYEGEHTLGDKRTAYEESLRIPLIVRYPRLKNKGITTDQMALNVDLAPTMLDYAGVTIPETMQGKSWRPLLEGENKPLRSAFFYEYFYENPYVIAPYTLAVRTDTAKLIKYPGHDDWTELFDLSADPFEMHNLFNDPTQADLRGKMLAEFDHQQAAVKYKLPENMDKPKPTTRPGEKDD